MSILIRFLAVNAALTVLFAIIKRRRREGAGIAVYFFFLPGLGFIFYFLPGLLRTFLKKVGVDREAVLTHAFEIERLPEHADVREALNVVPVEDAMAVSGKTEKRALLLSQLKKDLKRNYKILLVAEQDEDSESAHYVAAAKMEIYRLEQTRWLECRRDYEKDPDNPEKYHTACEVLIEMLDSSVFSPREQNAYRQRLCGLVQKQIDALESVVSPIEYQEYLNSLVELGRYGPAQLLWQKYGNEMHSEAAYHSMLKMFYLMGDRENFENILNDLRNDKRVRLSAKGLEKVRYLINRLSGERMDDLLRTYSFEDGQE